MADRFPISARLARIARFDHRPRQMFVYIERHRLRNLWEERQNRRRAGYARNYVRQLNRYITELEEGTGLVTVAHALAILRMLVSVEEQRIRLYNRETLEAARVADLLMDFLGLSLSP
ncbi:hypothetical protein CTI12_AA217640 [Artemisia annua]|uniref:Uncharacterized protein n=1 Tax=Artemisia annua TaxID=35608 RepID=A0A2U1NQB5_ARTAN|nr:hypothetical protein CTI12_AA217640 [Artemisia annua]